MSEVILRTADIVSIDNLGEFGAVFKMVKEPHEHVHIPFEYALERYTEAVDRVHEFFAIKETPHE